MMKTRQTEDGKFPIPVKKKHPETGEEQTTINLMSIDKWNSDIVPIFEDEVADAETDGFTEGSHPNKIFWIKGDDSTGRFRIERRAPAIGDVFEKGKRTYYLYKENPVRVQVYDANGAPMVDDDGLLLTEMKYVDASYTAVHKDPDGKRKRYSSVAAAAKDAKT